MLAAGSAGAVCQDALVLKIRNPVPLHAGGGEIQTWPFTFSSTGSASVYATTITTNAGAFTNRAYVGGSFTFTLTGGLTVQPSWATSATAGTWTDGEPPDATGPPLWLRWRLSTLALGSTPSGELSYRATVQTGPEIPLVTALSATMSCDAGEAVADALPFSVTATGGRIAPPLVGLRLRNGPANGVDTNYGVAVDGVGGVYTAGWLAGSPGGDDWRIEKHDSALSVLLAATGYAGAAGGSDQAVAVAVAGNGDVIVAGNEFGTTGGSNWRIRRYNAALTALVASTDYNGPAGTGDYVFAVALDGGGNVIVAGAETGLSGLENWAIRKYNATLSTLVAATVYNGPGNSYDEPAAVVVSPNGDVVVAGYETGIASGQDWRIRRYDAGLATLVATTAYDGPIGGDDDATGIGFDPNGSLWAAGFEDVPSGSPNVRIRKYDASLRVLLASTSYNGPGNGADFAYALAVDAGGGPTVGGSQMPVGGGLNWMVRRYDNALNLIDSVSHDGLLAGQNDQLRGLVLSGISTVYLAADETVFGESLNAAVARYDLTSFTHPTAPPSLTASAGVLQVALAWTPSTAGTRAVTGYRVYRQTFAEVSEASLLAQVNGSLTTMYVDGAAVPGTLYFYRVAAVDALGAQSALSSESSAGSMQPCLPSLSVAPEEPRPMYAGGGAQQRWRVSFSNGGAATQYNVTITTQGISFLERTYVSGSLTATITGGGVLTASAYSSAGPTGPWTSGEPLDGMTDPLWLKWTVDRVGPGQRGEIGIRTLAEPGLYATITFEASAGLSCDPGGVNTAETGYSVTATGERAAPPTVWVDRFKSRVPTAFGSPAAVGVDPAGGIWAVGSEDVTALGLGYDWIVRRYAPDGELGWSLTESGPATSVSDEARGIGFDSAGNAVVGGYEDRNDLGQGRNWVVRKYTPTGALLWSVSANNAFDTDEEIWGVAVASSGAFVAAGWQDTPGQGWDWVVRGYDAAGNQLWSDVFNGSGNSNDSARGVALTSDGGCVVVGFELQAGGDPTWRIRRYTAAGTLIWSRSSGTPGTNDQAWGVATDSANRVYVAGFDSPPLENTNFRVEAWDPSGALEWSRTYNSPVSSADVAQGVAVDDQGNVIVVGYEDRSDIPQGNNWFIWKLDNGGNLLHEVSRDGLDSGSEGANAVAVIPGTADVVVGGGDTAQAFLTGAVGRFTLNAFAPPGAPGALTAYAAGPGHVLLGWAPAASGTRGAPTGYAIVRGGAPGVEASAPFFVATVPGTATFYDDLGAPEASMAFYRVFALDSGGAAGPLSAEAAVFVPATPCTPVVTVAALTPVPQYAATGEQQLWRFSFSNSGGSTVYNLTITTLPGSIDHRVTVGPSLSATIQGAPAFQPSWATAAGGPWTAGEVPDYTAIPLYLRWVVGSLAPGAKGELSYRTAMLSGSDQIVQSLVSATLSCDPAGISGSAPVVTATGTGARIAYPALAVRMSSTPAVQSDVTRMVDVDAAGNMAVLGAVDDSAVGQGRDWLLQYFDNAGALVWSRTYNSANANDDLPFAVRFDQSGNLLAVGYELRSDLGQGQNWRIAKYDAAGNLLWQQIYNGVANSQDYAIDVAADASGNVYVAGYEQVAGQGLNGALHKYDAAGATLWHRTYNDAANSDDVFYGVAAGSNGTVAVCGYEYRPDLGQDYNALVRLYDGAGNVVWTRTHDGPVGGPDAAVAVVMDADGNVTASGNETVPGQLGNWVLRRYDPAGQVRWTTSYDSPANNQDAVWSMNTNSSGSLAVVGYETRSDLGQGRNWLLRQYDNGGNLLESIAHDDLVGGDDELHAAAPYLGFQQMWVAGEQTVAGGGQQMTLVKYTFLNGFTLPGTPGGLTAFGGPGSVNLSWSVATNGGRPVSGYRVYRQTTPGVLPTLQSFVTQVNGAVNYADTAVAGGIAYFYRVLAVDAAGAESPLSGEVAATPAGACPQALLTVSFLQSPPAPGAGQPVTYRIVVTNAGAGTITGLIVTDTVSPVLVGVTADQSAGVSAPVLVQVPGSGTRYEWTGPASLAPGTSFTLTVTGTVSQVCPATAVTSMALAAGVAGCAGPVTAAASAHSLVGSTIATIAGTGIAGYNGDGIPATAAELWIPYGVAVDRSGTVYIADQSNQRIRKIVAGSGVIEGVAGTGTPGYNGDGIAATSAQIATPRQLAVDLAGNVYFADQGNQRVRKVSVATGVISTVAGTGTGGYNGDGIAATTAQLNTPLGVAVDAAGNVYIADAGSHRVRMVSAANGQISTIAGTGTPGYNGDGIAATTAQLNNPYGVAVDGAGNVYVADTTNYRVRMIAAATGQIGTVAGTGAFGYNGDGIAATAAQLNAPYGVAVDEVGNLYIADSGNNRVRQVLAGNGQIATVAGTGTAGYDGDGQPAAAAQVNAPPGVAVDRAGNLYIADQYEHRVRLVGAVSGFTALPPAPALTVSVQAVPAAPGIGETVRYRIVVENAGPTPVDTLTVADTVPALLVEMRPEQPGAMGAPTVTAVPGGRRYLWSATGAGLLPPGQSLTFTVTGEVGTVCAAAPTVNVAFVGASDGCASGAQVSGPATFTVQPATASSSLVKTQTLASPAAGQPVTYGITVANTGTATLSNLVVVETISPVVTGAVAAQPVGVLPPLVTSVAGGTRFVWSGSPVVWASRASLSTGRSLLAVVAVGGTLYAIGGGTGGPHFQTVEAWDAATDSWTTKAPMPTARSGMAAAAFGGKIYVAGGWDGVTRLATLEIYDVATDSWTTGAPMPTGRSEPAGSFVDGKFYVTGGFNGSVDVATTEAYDPVANSWAGRAPMALVRSGLATVAVGGTLYAIGGSTSPGPGASVANVEAYDPATNTWVARAPMPSPRWTLAAGVVEGHVYALGGANVSFLAMSTVEDYDPVANAWLPAWSMPVSRREHGAAVVGGRLVVAGGFNGGFPGPAEEATIGIRPGATFTFTVTGTVGAVGVTTAVSNTAWVALDGPCGPAGGFTNPTGFTAAPPGGGAFLTAVVAVPSVEVPGHAFTVTLTVTNTGGNDANAVTATIFVSGTAGVTVLPGEPVPQLVKIGEGKTFSWSFVAAGPGTAFFTASATGTDAILLTPVSTSAARGMPVLAPARLAAAIALSPNPVPARRVATIRITVTNTGGVDATGVTPILSLNPTSGATLLESPPQGPFPAGPVMLAPGAAATFAWTMSAYGNATYDATVNAWGADAVSGFGLSATAFASGQAAGVALLTATLTVSPVTASVGEIIVARLTVLNDGAESVTGLVPSIVVQGAPLLTLLDGPSPSFVLQLDPDSATVFVWTYSVTGAGPLAFTARADGASLGVLGGAAAAVAPTASLTVEPPTTVAEHVLDQVETQVAPYPNPVPPGGDTVNLAIQQLPRNATRISVEIYNAALDLLRRAEFSGGDIRDGGISLSGVRNWPPGVYLVRVTVVCVEGQAPRIYPLTRVVVER